MSMPVSPAVVLARAADIIGQRGWSRGAFRCPDGRLCAITAIWAAAGVEPPPGDDGRFNPNGWPGWTPGRDVLARLAQDMLRRWLAAHVYRPGHLCSSVTGWNDQCAADATDVVGGLRAAAEAEMTG